MAHMLAETDGKVAMAYVGQTPWHGLGQKLTQDANLDTWIQEAGFDWSIRRAKVRYAVSHHKDDQAANAFRVIDDKVVLHRSDTGNALGVVSDGYKVVQPKEIANFFRDLVEGEGFTMNTMGCLFDGRKFWALAHIGDEAHILDRADRIGGYLLLSTSADGSSATEARFTSVRVVCNNTLSFAENAKANVRVTHRSKFDPVAAKGKLGIQGHEAFAGFINQMRDLAEKPASWADIVRMTVEMLADKKTAEDVGSDAFTKVATSKAGQTIGQLALGDAIGSHLKGAKGTAYAWLQAVTQYTDHMARARSAENRLNSAWFGLGENLKAKALELATAL
jgi:phage/plasmid-like protein (TIGR03299 family)